MDAERREDEIDDATQQMARGGDQMEERLDQLGDDIDEAKSVAAQRPDSPHKRQPAGEKTPESEAEGDEVAGDWQGESSGAEQGEDAEDVAKGPQAGADDEGQAQEAEGSTSRDDDGSDDEDER